MVASPGSQLRTEPAVVAGTPGAGESGGPAEPVPVGAAPAFSPLYQQIKVLLIQALQGGEWRPGALMPSEQDLAARYRVSQGTVRKAIDELAAERLVVRRQGKGTFVATHGEAQSSFRFLKLRPDDGPARPFERRFLGCSRLRATAEVARALALRSGDAVVQLERVLSTDGVPVVLEEIWLPGTLFKGLTAERLSQYSGPMYALFESAFGVRMIRAAERLKAVAADAQQARLLQVQPGAPLLATERVAYTYGDRPVELRRGHYSTASHHYPTDLN